MCLRHGKSAKLDHRIIRRVEQGNHILVGERDREPRQRLWRYRGHASRRLRAGDGALLVRRTRPRDAQRRDNGEHYHAYRSHTAHCPSHDQSSAPLNRAAPRAHSPA